MIHHSRFDVNLVIRFQVIILSELACLSNLDWPNYKGAPVLQDIAAILMRINNKHASFFHINMFRIMFPGNGKR